jgi:vWA-MoxR associated protein C-terminal domain
MEASRVALIRYSTLDGVRYVGSGLLIDDRRVLTADHVAEGRQHEVECNGGVRKVVDALRSGTTEVDLAVLTLSEPFAGMSRLKCAQVDRRLIGRVDNCWAVGFPQWRKGVSRESAQVGGHVPTADGLRSEGSGLRPGRLTLVGDQLPSKAPYIPEGTLSEAAPSKWGGMSGAVVTAGDLVLGVVRSHNIAADGRSLTITPVTAVDQLPDGVRQKFWAALGVAEPGKLPLLPRKDHVNAPVIMLGRDVQDAYWPVLSTALNSPDVLFDWSLDELSELHRRLVDGGQGISKAGDTLTALHDALTARPVFLEAGGSALELSQLLTIYWREVGAWPVGNSADALLVEAASAGIVERRKAVTVQPLSPLARFVIGVAAATRSPFDENGPMASWVTPLGHQLADAQAHYRQRRDDSAWLIIDFGDEPQDGAATWPSELTWTLIIQDGEPTGGSVACEATQSGLKRALADVLRDAARAHPLLVDLALPRALMDEGIEHWEVVESDGVREPLSAECQPRLRWSRRSRDARLYTRLVDRIRGAHWDGNVKKWLMDDPRQACFLGGRDLKENADSLRRLLREGRGFIIWFPSGLPDSATRDIAKAIRGMPELVRRHQLPSRLPPFGTNYPAVIWDDPDGRNGFRLPPLVVPESL